MGFIGIKKGGTQGKRGRVRGQRRVQRE